MAASRSGTAVRLFSRHGTAWHQRLPWLVEAVAALPCQSVVLDGELIAGRGRRADFAELAAVARSRSPSGLSLVAFDLLHLDGHDLRGCTQRVRKSLLDGLLAGASGGGLLYATHLDGSGAHAFEHADRLGFEGIIAKRADAPYRAGRTRAWLKVKTVPREALAVVGIADRQGKVALVLARPRAGGWAHAATVSKVPAALLEQLAASWVMTGDAPFPLESSGVVWCVPERVVEVRLLDRDLSGRHRRMEIVGMTELTADTLLSAAGQSPEA